ncbi:MAG: RNA methyltransferase [Phycisphaerales bacterium]|jgi:TrmH family RNA methyltransferase|nr:RNA methyltransferase [Phycisphaerales bacterium]
MAFLLAETHVVLVRPQGAANLGAVARALKNFGLSRLTLVDSRIGSLVDARRMAVHAEDVLAGARACASLAEATAGATWLVATTDAPPPGARVLTPRQLVDESLRRGAPTIVFGGEQHGLEPGELLRCHAVATIPVAPQQTSLNLAQAVCVFAAELFAGWLAAGGWASAAPAPAAAAPAPAELMHRLEAALAALLQESAWRDASRPKHAIAELLQPLWRAGLTEAEVRLWLVALGRAGQLPRR